MAVLVGAGAGKGGEGAPSVPLEVTLPAFPAVSVGAGCSQPWPVCSALATRPLHRYNMIRMFQI